MRPKTTNPKAERLSLRLTAGEKRALFDNAKRQGKKPSALARGALLELLKIQAG